MVNRTAAPIRRLRQLALLEGVSFLLLLGVAMPLKYFASLPAAVQVVGWAHGVLFVLVVASLLQVWLVARWPLLRVALVFLATLVPFGPFLLDRRLQAFQRE